MEIVWIKAEDSGGNDGGDCVWVAEVAPLRAQLGPGAVLTICDEFILDTSDVVVRDEYQNLTQYTYREFGVFILGVKQGNFDYILERMGDSSEMKIKEAPVHISPFSPKSAPILNYAEVNRSEFGRGRGLGYVQIDPLGNITGKITMSELLNALRTGDARVEYLYADLAFPAATEVMKG